MKILLLHPEDSPLTGSWAAEKWDLMVDLGFASPSLYAEWSRQLATRIVSLRAFSSGEASYRWIGRALTSGRGHLLDRMGLDWWELAAVWKYQDLEALYLIQQLAREIHATSVELFATRRHTFAALFAQVISRPIRYFQTGNKRRITAVTRMARSLRQFSSRQITEIAFDKWDPDYRFRRHLAKQRAECHRPVVLLPSAYSNVTRTVLAYAAALPGVSFLLAATRTSAFPNSQLENVTTVPLAAYAICDQQTEQELAELNNAWRHFQSTVLSRSDDLRIALDAGIFDYFPQQLRNGLLIRDAWHCLMQYEPVTGVLCGDDLNYYTRLPLVLAKSMKLNAVYCSHGALDSGSLFKQSYSDVHLVKGEMERDYALRSGTVPTASIVIAAPSVLPAASPGSSATRDKIVFFSQPYEVDGGRTGEIYRELVPRLCSLARTVGKRLVIKLHPFESASSRTRLLASVLRQKSDLDSIQIVGPGAPDTLMNRAWCGVGVNSSVAVECALKGIPFFLCQWLDFLGGGYMQQFARFGAGTLLQSPQAIETIPQLVSRDWPDERTRARLWSDAGPGRLEAIIVPSSRARAAASFAS